MNKKQYVGISRDHSGSMSSLRHAAIKDYNDGIKAIKTAANDNNIDTVASVVSCGIGSGVQREVVNSSISALTPLTSYTVDGGTPLFDSVGELIEIFKSVPDYRNPNVTFLGHGYHRRGRERKPSLVSQSGGRNSETSGH
jgi:hypothetical protein